MFSLLLSLLFFSLLFLLTRRLKFLRFNHLKHTLHAAKCVVVLLQLGQDRTHVQQALRGEEKGVYHISTHICITHHTLRVRVRKHLQIHIRQSVHRVRPSPPRVVVSLSSSLLTLATCSGCFSFRWRRRDFWAYCRDALGLFRL